jgi:hypothetical protein
MKLGWRHKSVSRDRNPSRLVCRSLERRRKVTVSLPFLARVSHRFGFSHKDSACVPFAPLRSIAARHRIARRQLRFGVDPKNEICRRWRGEKEITS